MTSGVLSGGNLTLALYFIFIVLRVFTASDTVHEVKFL